MTPHNQREHYKTTGYTFEASKMKKTVVTCVVVTIPMLIIALAATAWWQYANWLVSQ